MANLGRAVTILKRFEDGCQAEWDDLAAFHAPDECGVVVARGQARRFRAARRHACHVAGVRNMRLLRRAILRAVPTWDRYNHFKLGVQAL